MPSEMIQEVILTVGNAHRRQRGPGPSVVAIYQGRTRAQYRKFRAQEIATREQENRPMAGWMWAST
jgi:hypothetical protein